MRLCCPWVNVPFSHFLAGGCDGFISPEGALVPRQWLAVAPAVSWDHPFQRELSMARAVCGGRVTGRAMPVLPRCCPGGWRGSLSPRTQELSVRTTRTSSIELPWDLGALSARRDARAWQPGVSPVCPPKPG